MAILGTASKPGLLINRDFALLWTSHTLSVVGDFIFETTLVVWIATELAPGRSWAPLAVSGLLVASAVPVLVVGPVAGVFVDRWRDKRRVMVRADALSGALILALLPVTGILPLPYVDGQRLPVAARLAAILVVVFLASAVAQFFRPSAGILVRDVVPEPLRARAIGLNQASTSVALLAGPPLAAPLLFAFGPAWALLINAASFFASLLAILAVRVAPQPDAASRVPAPSGVFRDFVLGLRFFGRSRELVTVAASLVIVMVGFGALGALGVFFVTENLGASAESYGILGAAQGAGMLLGAVLAGAFAARIGLARTLWASLAATGLLILLYARLTSFSPAVVMLFLLGASIQAASVSVGPIVLRATPREFLGRVSGTINPLIQAALILGLLVGGLLYGILPRGSAEVALGIRIGPLDGIFTGAGVLCLLGAAYARRNLRDAPHDGTPSEHP